ncbi:MAG: hypothetical protein JW994_00530 [Candidatus Omnitrophica bacterium]|nr:hypothetical protein [Candidatus Omnitrophota bacterium]
MCLVALFTASDYAEGRTMPYNGESWNDLSKLKPPAAALAKKMLIRGVYEGAFTTNPDKARKILVTDKSFESLVLDLDSFYTDPRNLKIPIGLALRVISMELQGEPQEVIDSYLENLRVFIDETLKKFESVK